jgi:glutamate/tyrosine decarboxylase-like PLP-dependent enzyme
MTATSAQGRGEKGVQRPLRAILKSMDFSGGIPNVERVLPTPEALTKARDALISKLPSTGLGSDQAIQHIRHDITPGFNASSQSPNYYGFVTGGSTPAATLADNIVTEYDQNVQVHLPSETIATNVEDAALRMLCQLLRLDENEFVHRIFTTGATASNILGLACGREWVHRKQTNHYIPDDGLGVGELGLVRATRCTFRGLHDSPPILTSMPHSSIRKAASLVGLGRASVEDVGREDDPVRFDMEKVAERIRADEGNCIIVVSCGEVNTGRFATTLEDMRELRRLSDKWGCWIHVDGAFGIMARLFHPDEPSDKINNYRRFNQVAEFCAGIELADSIGGDGHKLLNVPYDCGFFLSKDRDNAINVFQNSGAAYLSSAGGESDDIASPLHIGIENSRRFRALPVYASLVAYGADGYRDMLARQIDLARRIARIVLEHDAYELLPKSQWTKGLEEIFIIVLFRAVDDDLNKNLVRLINETRRIYISGTAWDGKPAARFAISNWQVDVNRDSNLIKQVLDEVSFKHRGSS